MGITEKLVEVALKLVLTKLEKRSGAGESKYLDSAEIEAILSRYLLGVARWSEDIQFLGMGGPEETDKVSISLSFNSIPRKYRGMRDNETAELAEDTVLLDGFPYAILGDPGSGKTTTIKRLIRILLREEPRGPADFLRTPIVIRLRDIEHIHDVYEMVANALGLPVTIERVEGQKRKDANEETRSAINGLPSRVVVLDLLDKLNAVLFLDGMDESATDVRASIYDELQDLARNLQCAKVVITSRSGDYYRNLQGFRILEILPLSRSQIREIASRQLRESSAERFLEALDALPYRDLADRPLLLAHLLFIYTRSGRLPEQPGQVYKKMASLLLEHWDEQRGVVRVSKYGRFDPERKLEFLAAIAFDVSFRHGKRRMTSTELLASYHRIRQSFNLPENEGQQVVREIESHTGILVEIAGGFEFSHLSLQEFLAGYHMVRAPYSPELVKYLEENPAPVAVAIAISSDPAKWFSGLVLKEDLVSRFDIGTINSFVERLAIEKPFFAVDPELGYAVIRLFNSVWKNEIEEHRVVIDRLLAIQNVGESLLEALRNFKIVNPIYENVVYIAPAWERVQLAVFRPDEQLVLPKRFVMALIKRHNLQVDEVLLHTL